jgi:hypothetical protein
MNSGAINLAQPVSSSPLNRGLVGWWLALPQRMGGGRFLDLCQPGNHGTLNGGLTWQSAAGRPGGFGSLKWSANTDYVPLPNMDVGKSAEDFTLAAWFVTPGTSSDIILDNYQGGANEISLYAQSGVIKCYYGGTLTGVLTVTANIWNHAALVRTGTTLQLFLNGVGDSSVVSGSGNWSSAGFTLGNFYNGTAGTSAMAGSIDDARIYRRSLSASEITALYNDSRTGYQQTLNRLPRRSYAVAGGGGGGAIGPQFGVSGSMFCAA